MVQEAGWGRSIGRKFLCHERDRYFLRSFPYNWAVSMTKCKKRSMMPPEIERVRGEQFRGTLKPSNLRGRVFSLQAIASRSSWMQPLKSLPLGKYCGNRPLVFSLMPRGQDLCGSAK